MKIYTRRYSNVGNAQSPAISIPAGQLLCVKVPMSSEGKISKLAVDQLAVGAGGGTAVGFTVELLDSVVPFPVGAAAYTTVPADSISHYRVTPTQSVAAGGVYELDIDNPGYPYVNTDGNSTVNQRAVYLVIIPNNAGGVTLWRATITSISDVF